MVDLAGSERLAKTGVADDFRLKESMAINKSLSALGDVMAALGKKQAHVPYRNSKITHLLQDSLGGSAKTLMFVNCSPDAEDAAETSSTLMFGTRVRSVELGRASKSEDRVDATKGALRKAGNSVLTGVRVGAR